MNMEENKQGFLKNHADTVAIIGVNLAIAAILLSLFIMNASSINAVNSRMDAANIRMDQTNLRIDTTYKMFYDLLDEFKNKGK